MSVPEALILSATIIVFVYALICVLANEIGKRHAARKYAEESEAFWSRTRAKQKEIEALVAEADQIARDFETRKHGRES